MSATSVIIKANGEREVFDKSKLEYSLAKSGASKKTIDLIVDHIAVELRDGMSTSQIYTHAFFLLNKMEKPVAARYSLRHALMALGPTGFPFEDFVGEIFKSKGYTVQTGVLVEGHCVVHEVDVVAYNEHKLIMSEVKFHNELGLRSDLKVALYVKARFDDLKEKEFNYGKKRTLDEGWLITNTKFTNTAIEYGMCNGIHMIGWNFPKKGNLQDMIEDAGVHPITCLSTLNSGTIKMLLERGIVLCKALNDQTEVLRELGLSSEEIDEVRAEIKFL